MQKTEFTSKMRKFLLASPLCTSHNDEGFSLSLSLSLSLLEKFKKQGKAAFTLAEVLITLAVIGIVAALTIGIFLPKIHSTIRARQIATAEVKFTKAMEQMALNNAIGPYYETTQEFVDELQNYLKVSKVCANDKLEECFGYDKITTQEGKEYEIKDIVNGNELGMDEDGTDYKETIGIVTIDGTAMLLSWNKNCPILEPKVYQWGGNTNETTGCVAAVMDINLDRSPNMLNKDVALFRAKQLGSECGIEFKYGGNKHCWSTAFVPSGLSYEECQRIKGDLGIKDCCWNVSLNRACYSDSWGGAVKACGGTSKMPSRDDLADMANYLYGTTTIDNYHYVGNLTMDVAKLANISPELAAKFSPTSNGFYMWSNEEYDRGATWTRWFGTNYTVGGEYGIDGRQNTGNYSVCKIR